MRSVEKNNNPEILDRLIIPSVQVVFTRQKDQQTEFFLVHKITDSFKGQWCFPGGKLDPGETSIQAACREPHEETGVDVQESDLHYFRTTTSYTNRQINGKQFFCEYKIDVFIINAQNLFPYNASPDEHDQAQWFTQKKALEMHSLAVDEALKSGINVNLPDKIPDALAPKTLETIKMLSING